MTMNYRNEANEADTVTQHTVRKRTIKSQRKRKEAKSKANPARPSISHPCSLNIPEQFVVYHGARGRYHYFECLQLMLRKQVATLMKLWMLPEEFEVICRDLWALHLDLLPDPPGAEPYHFAHGHVTGKGKTLANAETSNDNDNESEEESEKQSDEENQNDDRRTRNDPELEALLHDDSDLDDSSEDQEDEKKSTKLERKIKRQRRGHQVYETPASTIAILVVGCWTLRLPVFYRDFIRQDCQRSEYLVLTCIDWQPDRTAFEDDVHIISNFYPGGQWWTHALASCVTRVGKHALTKRLGQILSVPLTLHHTLAPGLEKHKTYDPERHIYDNVAPEVSLMGVAIIVLKMVYGLDGRERIPIDRDDVACAMPRGDEFLAGLKILEKEEEKVWNTSMRFDVWKEDIEMIDAYLDFSERVLIGNGDGSRKGGNLLERFFPIKMSQHEGHSGVASGQNEAIVADAVQGMRPGEGYRIYRAHDVGGTMSAEWATVIGRAARWTQVSVEAMSAVVETFHVVLVLTAGVAVDHDDHSLLVVPMRRLVAVFKRDKHSPPPLVTDHAQSSASSSSGSASLCLQTPDDDPHLPATVARQSSRKSWRSWLKGSVKNAQHPSLPDWSPPAHDIEDSPSEPSVEENSSRDALQSFLVLVKNGLHPPPPAPRPFSHSSELSCIFPKSVNSVKLISPNHSLATLTFKKQILDRLQGQNGLYSQAELRSINPLASRRITPVVPVNQPHPFNESAPSKATSISFSSPGLGSWISRPCFEDRYDLYIPEQDGTISRRPVVGSSLAVAALEFSEATEAMACSDLTQLQGLMIEIPSETVLTPSSSAAHSRNSPYIATPSPLRNEHNPPPSPSVAISHSAPPTIPATMETDLSIKRGVRFADDGKEDVIPLGYVLRMKKKREEKAKFLKAEQDRRLLEEEGRRYEEERRRREIERAEWERERKAWEKEKRAMEEERRQRKYAEEVVAARLRRESQRAGGVPSLKAAESNAFLVPSSPPGHFPTSASSSTSERNKPSSMHRHSRPVYDGSGAPVYLPRREASEPNLPTSINTNPASFPITPSPRGSLMSPSPNSSRPPSLHRDRPPSADSSSPLPGTSSPSVNSSQEMSSEDVKAAVAAAASRAKRNSLAASASASRNNSSTSLLGDRALSAGDPNDSTHANADDAYSSVFNDGYATTSAYAAIHDATVPTPKRVARFAKDFF
ncbi:hypothetical protein H0H93_000137 [Arthromyces matolae]|nr:hypothetical protein H0H93_000137 [Arthromyces matolae]